jgi:ATP synthase F1 delta subunit
VENLTVDDVYGTALYGAAADLEKTGEFLDAIKMMADLFKSHQAFFLLLRTPSLSPSERKDLVRTVFDGRIPGELMNFLYVLLDKRRIGQFAGIAKAFEKAVNTHEGVSKGTIESAMALTEEQLTKFESETGKLLSRNVKLEPEINPALIGGVRIYIDGKLIDASIRRKLDELKAKIIS